MKTIAVLLAMLSAASAQAEMRRARVHVYGMD
jgi:hypothetical protein